MKVTIETKPEKRELIRKGFLAKLKAPEYTTEYVVRLHITPSEDEKAILSEHNLWDVEILETDYFMPPDERMAYPEIVPVMTGSPIRSRIKDLMDEKGFHTRFATPVDAKNFEMKLRNETLPLLKKYIDASAEAGKPSSDTFEL